MYHYSRSVGVSNFNANHMEELKKARPNNMPVGEFNVNASTQPQL